MKLLRSSECQHLLTKQDGRDRMIARLDRENGELRRRITLLTSSRNVLRRHLKRKSL